MQLVPWTSSLSSSSTWTAILAAPFDLPIGPVNYQLFTGPDEPHIDYTSANADAQAAPAFASVYAGDTIAVAITAVSEAGRSSEAVVVSAGAGGSMPGAIQWATARPYIGGKADIDFVFSNRGQASAASTIQIVEIIGGVPNWASVLVTASVGRLLTRGSVQTDATWPHGSTIRLAARAVTAGDTPGAVYILPPTIAKSIAPAPVDNIEVIQRD